MKPKHEVSTVMMQILVNIHCISMLVRSRHTISSEAKPVQYPGSNYIYITK